MRLHDLRVEGVGDIIETIGECVLIEHDHDGDSFHIFFVNPDTSNA